MTLCRSDISNGDASVRDLHDLGHNAANRRDRRRNHDDFGSQAGLRERAGDPIDAATFERNRSLSRIEIESDNVRAGMLAQGETNTASHQTEAGDRDLHDRPTDWASGR